MSLDFIGLAPYFRDWKIGNPFECTTYNMLKLPGLHCILEVRLFL